MISTVSPRLSRKLSSPRGKDQNRVKEKDQNRVKEKDKNRVKEKDQNRVKEKDQNSPRTPRGSKNINKRSSPRRRKSRDDISYSPRSQRYSPRTKRKSSSPRSKSEYLSPRS